MEAKTIWITGASSGIGEALAIEYASHGMSLILSSRRRNELERVAEICRASGSLCYILPFDLAEILSPQTLVREALAFTGRIDILINNGGISQRASALETGMDVLRKLMEINFFGQIALTQAMLPEFIKAGGGQFAVISSITGKFGYGLRSGYAASKHALHGYFESLAIENIKNNIRVTIVCPGRILTNMSLNAFNENGERHGQMDEGQKNGVSAAVCAKKIIKAIQAKKAEVLIGKKEIWMVYIKRFFPALFFRIAVRLNPLK